MNNSTHNNSRSPSPSGSNRGNMFNNKHFMTSHKTIYGQNHNSSNNDNNNRTFYNNRTFSNNRTKSGRVGRTLRTKAISVGSTLRNMPSSIRKSVTNGLTTLKEKLDPADYSKLSTLVNNYINLKYMLNKKIYDIVILLIVYNYKTNNSLPASDDDLYLSYSDVITNLYPNLNKSHKKILNKKNKKKIIKNIKTLFNEFNGAINDNKYILKLKIKELSGVDGDLYHGIVHHILQLYEDENELSNIVKNTIKYIEKQINSIKDKMDDEAENLGGSVPKIVKNMLKGIYTIKRTLKNTKGRLSRTKRRIINFINRKRNKRHTSKKQNNPSRRTFTMYKPSGTVYNPRGPVYNPRGPVYNPWDNVNNGNRNFIFTTGKANPNQRTHTLNNGSNLHGNSST
jgi:hypothetical protein